MGTGGRQTPALPPPELYFLEDIQILDFWFQFSWAVQVLCNLRQMYGHPINFKNQLEWNIYLASVLLDAYQIL